MRRGLLLRETLRATFSYPRFPAYLMMFALPAVVWVDEHGSWWPALVWLVVGLVIVRCTLSEHDLRRRNP